MGTVSDRTRCDRAGARARRRAYGADWFTRAAERKLHIHHVDEVTLYVRRHTGNVTHGKSLVELNQLRLFKKTLDRRRAQDLGDQKIA